jgi:hypothetical protein
LDKNSNVGITDKAVAAHFVSGSRHLISNFSAKLDFDLEGQLPVCPQTIASKSCNLFRLAPWVAKHRLGAFKKNTIKSLLRHKD